MESPKSVMSQLNGLSSSNRGESNSKGPVMSSKPNKSIGVLEVFVHHARDIQNICIYHKQDVYAKLCLTSDPNNSVSTKIINGGGRNPVFDDAVELDVKTVDCSLKCEIYMMSRVKNYLEDQLLGFTLVPFSEVILKNGKLEKEFSLSSSDLFHSPAGFVQLSLLYSGDSPEVLPISPPLAVHETSKSSELTDTIPSDLDKIEFMDPNIVSENHLMVSEYFGIPCTDNVDSETSETAVEPHVSINLLKSESGNPETNSIQAATVDAVMPAPLRDSPTSTVSTNGVSSPTIAVSSGSSAAPGDSKLSNDENVSGAGLKAEPVGKMDEAVVKPILSVNVEPEQVVVQQDIVDMYMKSMQQFTESLAKMKLPLELDSPTKSGNSSSSSQTPKSTGSRVFYGSRAFF